MQIILDGNEMMKVEILSRNETPSPVRTFTPEQRRQIVWGNRKGINTSIYAKPEFSEGQMVQIRVGLESGYSEEDVKSYADPSLTEEEMYERRMELEEKYFDRFREQINRIPPI